MLSVLRTVCFQNFRQSGTGFRKVITQKIQHDQELESVTSTQEVSAAPECG